MDASHRATPKGPQAEAAPGQIGRRRFLTYLVAAPTLTVASRFAGLDILSADPAAAEAAENYKLAILEITPENRIVMQVERLETGQAIATALAMLVAEELDARLVDIDLHLAAAGFVGGSSSMLTEWTPVRMTASTARAYLITAAAQLWNVDASTLTTHDTAVWTPDGRSASYGSLSSAAAKVIAPQVSPAPKPYSEHRVIGRSTKQLGARDLVTGKQQFAMDLQVVGALPTVVARPPTFGASVASVDESAARAVDGVVAIATVPTGVAVSAGNFYQAIKARDALGITWNPGPMDRMSDAEIRQLLESRMPSPPVPPPASEYVEGTFQFNFVSHSPLETFDAIADVRADGADVWVASQAPDLARASVAKALGMSPTDVTMHQVRGGGSFGSRYASDSVEAAQISQAIGRPVKLMWTRGDTVRNGWMRPAYRQHIRVAYAGREVLAWNHEVVGVALQADDAFTYHGPPPAPAFGAPYGVGENPGPSGFPDKNPYSFAGTQVEQSIALPMPVTFWRAPRGHATIPAREIMIDELAAAMGMDPVAFRLQFLSDDKSRALVEKVATAGNWGRPMPDCWAQGVAYSDWVTSSAACLVEIDATDPNAPRVTKAVVAANVGLPVNPSGLEAQLMGGVTDGIATVLQAGLHIDNGAVREGTFGAIQWPRQRHVPIEWEVYAMPADGDPGGAGELGVPPGGGAAANAYARATGTKARNFPIIDP